MPGAHLQDEKKQFSGWKMIFLEEARKPTKQDEEEGDPLSNPYIPSLFVGGNFTLCKALNY